MTQIHHIPTAKVAEYWAVVEPFLVKAAKRYSRDYDIEHVKAAIDSGDASLWLVMCDGKPMAAFTGTEINYPKRKTFLIELIGGIGTDLWYYDTVKQLEQVARAAGYDTIEAVARGGWKHMAKDCGFKEIATHYEMELR